MKILLATSKAIPSGGGIASYNQELVNLLGKDNDICLLSDSDETDVEGYKKCFTTFGQSLSDIGYCRRLTDHINKSAYDIIINSASEFIPVIAPFLKSAIISVSHFVNGKHAVNAGYNADYLNAIIALSNYGKDFIVNKFKINNKDKIKVVYNFVKQVEPRPLDRKIKASPLTIVYPGGTSIKKSVDVIQELIYKLIRSKLDFHFYWLGSTRLPSSKLTLLGLHDVTDLFHSDPRITITGFVPREKSMEIISNANVFLLPSRGEGCPMTLLEAMRGGCIPIVSDAHHGSREILEQAGVGFIAKQDSAQELFEDIKEIIVNHDKYISNYKKSRDYLNSHLSQEIWANAMYEIILDFCNMKKRQIPFTEKVFIKSYKGYACLQRIERMKEMLYSAKYRIKFDFQYLRNCLRNN